ncbi:MAG: FecR family protein, partial [Mucilaginibacter sp.]
YFFKDYWKQKDQHYANSELMFNKIRARIGVDETSDNVVELPKVKKRYILWRSIAAVLMITLCCVALYKLRVRSEEKVTERFAGLENTTTKPQTRSIITLTDGTKVTLNSESTLKYPASFNGKTREVYLVGEAFFDVHKDHQHPFIIHTGKMNIRVVGTAFNVKAYPNDITSETTLIRGMIEVTLNDRPSDRIILKPKEKLILKNNQVYPGKPSLHVAEASENAVLPQYTLTTLTYFKSQDTSVVETSWLKNRLIFRNEDFATLAERMQRWYGVNIIFKNDEVKLYRFNGIFEKETINQALDALQITEKFHYKIDKSNVLIY